jgi:hypothetical protein
MSRYITVTKEDWFEDGCCYVAKCCYSSLDKYQEKCKDCGCNLIWELGNE